MPATDRSYEKQRKKRTEWMARRLLRELRVRVYPPDRGKGKSLSIIGGEDGKQCS